MNLKNFFKEKGYDITEKEQWDSNIAIWKSWYKGKVSKFHNYYVYNGQKKVKREKKSLQAAKKVCEDWADLLLNEKVQISLKDQTATDTLLKILKDNNFEEIGNQGVELAFALSIGMFVVSIDNMLESDNIIDVSDAKTKIEFVQADKIYPLSWENGNITECAFVIKKTEKGKNYIYISLHLLNEQGNYIIENHKFESTKNNDIGIEIEDDSIMREFDTKNNIPWFAALKPNSCNNIDTDTIYGISIFANSIDVLKALDNAYNECDNEVVLGRRRTFISEEMMDYSSGDAQLTFDAEDISVYRMPKGFSKDSMFHSSSEQLRTSDYEKAVQFNLNMLSNNVGFGQERYKFDNGNISTATGVISENSDMYRRVKKHEIVLDNTLKKLFKAVIYATNTFTSEKISSDGEDIQILYDDSIIEDKGAEQVKAQTEMGLGVRSKNDYMKNIRGLGDDQIKEELEQIAIERQEAQQSILDDNSDEEKLEE